DEIVGAELDRRHRGFDVAVAGDHHHRQFRILLLDGAEQLQPVETAALQPDVEKHQARAARFYRRQRVVAVARGARAIPLVLENPRDQLANVTFVIDDENIWAHGRPTDRLRLYGLPARVLRLWRPHARPRSAAVPMRPVRRTFPLASR